MTITCCPLLSRLMISVVSTAPIAYERIDEALASSNEVRCAGPKGYEPPIAVERGARAEQLRYAPRSTLIVPWSCGKVMDEDVVKPFVSFVQDRAM